MAKSRKEKGKHRHSVIPLSGQILIQQEKTEKITKSGIFIPEAASGKPLPKGQVIACAKDCKKVKVGDSVMFPEFVGYTVPIGEQEYLAMHEDDLFATLCEITEEKETDNV